MVDADSREIARLEVFLEKPAPRRRPPVAVIGGGSLQEPAVETQAELRPLEPLRETGG